MRRFLFIIILFSVFACRSSEKPAQQESSAIETKQDLDISDLAKKIIPAAPKPETVQKAAAGPKDEEESVPEADNIWEKKMQKLGLQKVALLVDAVDQMAYTEDDNVFKLDLYADFESCYLQKEAVALLIKADSLLRNKHPELRFKLLDCARPYSVQLAMWEAVAGKPERYYVASPKRKSIHNYGLAVDLTLVDASGVELDMGTPFDHFGVAAQPREEKRLLEMKVLTKKHIANREILRHAMYGAGFKGIPNEWWHYNAVSRTVAREKYPLLDF